jgi:formimidoylglutamate deiminase
MSTFPAKPHQLWASRAWIDGAWQNNVLLSVDENGYWNGIEANVIVPPTNATILSGSVLPGMVNAHSHAFQRTFAGQAEQPKNSEQDNFWSWRDQMYQVALRISPAELKTIASQLYIEMLQGGYTQVCEFHYLHHAPDGEPYPESLAMTWALVEAAQDVGIGLTMLPVLYERAGFFDKKLRVDQRRFSSSADSVWAMHQAVMQKQHSRLNAGVAIHSLRAASLSSIQQLKALVGDTDIPIHIHIAEQTGEVDDCLAATKLRPIEYLAGHVQLDARWQLVHATHAEPFEIDAVAKSGSGLVICPTTEANLGDGIADMPRWQSAGVPLAIGSDSNVSRDWREELRWLEYGQRLALRKRNVCINLFDSAIKGGGRAAGFHKWGLVVGACADALVLDLNQEDKNLDAYIFACDKSAMHEVYVAGQCVLKNGQPSKQPSSK